MLFKNKLKGGALFFYKKCCGKVKKGANIIDDFFPPL